jgi:glycosyltransferase involved in cell wall biosynthesis
VSGGIGRLAVVTPWYPRPDKIYGGIFVREWTRALAAPPGEVTVVHLEMVPPGDPRQPCEAVAPEGRILWAPVKVGDHLPRAAAARAQLAAATPAQREAIAAAEVVFAHATMPTGWPASQLARPGQTLVLVEHASYVPQLLRHPQARVLFAEAVERAEAVLTAGEATAELIRQALPQARAKVWAVGNPLDAAAFPFARRPAQAAFKRWLYLGNLHFDKGVLALVEALAAYSGLQPRARLALAGQGVAEPALRALAERLGVAGRVDFLGGLERAGVVAALAEADLLVHLSPGETFGLAPLEGLLSGLPVLAARNAGTSQTMGAAVAAGRALLVDPPAPGPRGGRAVAQGIARLGQQVLAAPPGAALAVRQQLAERYGWERFGDLERRVARRQPPYPPPDAARPPLAVAARSRGAWAQAAEVVRAALWEGRPVVAAAPRASITAGADPRVRIELVAEPSAWAAVAGLACRAVWLAGAAPLKAAGLALRAARRAPLAPRAALGRWQLWASRRLAAFNQFNRLRLDPALRRALGGRRAGRAWGRAAALRLPPGAEVRTFPADGPGLIGASGGG